MTPGLDLAGRVAVVTGGAGGIGVATARALAENGVVCVLADRDPDAAEAAASGIRGEGLRAHAVTFDVADEAAVEAGFAAVAREHGPVSILVNGAGLSIRKGLGALSLAEWERVLAVNATGTFLCARAAASQMAGRGDGAVVNVASIMGLSGGGPYPNPAYQASKGAVVNLTRALAVELAPEGIRVNAVAPTWVRTPFIGPLMEDEAGFAAIRALMPLGRIAEPEEVAAAILFLASPMASMITGHTLPVDGGFLAL